MQEVYLRSLPATGPVQNERRLLTQLRYQAAMSMTPPSSRMDALSALMQSDNNFVPAAVSYGDALVAAGKSDEAVKHWERIFRNVPRIIFIERILSQQTAPKDRQRTLTLMKKYAQSLDADAVHLVTARVALEEGDTATAATELEAINRKTAPAVQLIWARLYAARNESEQATDALTKVAEQTAPYSGGYRCTACGGVSADWVGCCRSCLEYDTYRPAIECQDQPSA